MIRNAGKKPRPGKAAIKRARDVRPRLERQRAERKRSARRPRNPLPRRLALMVLTVAAVSLALLTTWAFLSTSSLFAVTKAEVLGVRHLSRLEVLSAGGVGAHSNLLALPVGRLEQRIRRLGWVRRVRVSRRPPHTVRIEIQERTPRCLVLVEGRLYYLDSDLKSFASTLGEAPPDLPVITGLKRADLANPDDEMKDLLAAAGRLLDQLPRTDLGPGGPVSEIHIDRVWGLGLVRDDLPALVRLGFKNFGPRLAALQRVAADLRRRGELERAVLIDLESSRRVVVRLDRAA